MLPNIKKIVYATDLAPNSQAAFAYAAGLAEKCNAELIVLHVHEWNLTNPFPFLRINGFKGKEEWDEIEKKREAQTLELIKLKMEEMCAEMNSRVPSCNIGEEQIVIQTGVPFEKILKVVNQAGADLIVIGTHGNGMVQDVLVGGTVRRLARKSEKPVLVAPVPPESSPKTLHRGF